MGFWRWVTYSLEGNRHSIIVYLRSTDSPWDELAVQLFPTGELGYPINGKYFSWCGFTDMEKVLTVRTMALSSHY